jgi:hypothetical protein
MIKSTFALGQLIVALGLMEPRILEFHNVCRDIFERWCIRLGRGRRSQE